MAMDDTARPSSAPRASLADDNAHVGSLILQAAELSYRGWIAFHEGLTKEIPRRRVWFVKFRVRYRKRLKGVGVETVSSELLANALERAVRTMKHHLETGGGT